MVPTVRLKDVRDGLEFLSDESSSFLAVETGEVVTVSNELLDAAQDFKDGDEEPYFPEWQIDEWEEARMISAPDGEKKYLPMPSQFELNEWEMLKDFADAFPQPEIRDDLQRSIRGSGAFRRFKDACERHGILEQWYAFRDEALFKIARDWCVENDVRFTE